MKRIRLWLRRAAYIILLLAGCLYYVFQTTYLSWILFLSVTLLPLFSFFLSLFLHRKGRLILHCRPSLGTVTEGFSLSLERKSPLLPAEVRAKVQIHNLFSGETEKRKLFLSSKEAECMELERYCRSSMGVVECRILRAYVPDFFKLFSIFLPVSKPVRVLLLPVPIPFPEETAANTISEEADAHANFKGGEREWKDVREYREGDLLRDIHWKLSSRRSQIIVREYEESSGAAAPVLMHWCGSPKQLEQKLARLIGLVSALEQVGLPYCIHVTAAEGRQFEAYNSAEAEQLFWSLLESPCPDKTAVNPAEESLLSWALLVEADAVLLCQDGTVREGLV
jgi:uncharacterized protein (DUF58 family)